MRLRSWRGGRIDVFSLLPADRHGCGSLAAFCTKYTATRIHCVISCGALVASDGHVFSRPEHFSLGLEASRKNYAAFRIGSAATDRCAGRREFFRSGVIYRPSALTNFQSNEGPSVIVFRRVFGRTKMLQGACCSRPVYGHSHYKKFWLKKMESEDEQSRLPPEAEYFRVSSERGGAFWRTRGSTGGNCSALELKGSSTSGIRLSSVRSTEDKPRGTGKQNLTVLEGTELECALALGLQMPHPGCFPPLKGSAFGEEQKPWELVKQNRHKLTLHGGADDSQSGRSRADGDRYVAKVNKEYMDPEDEVFGTEEVREEEISLASVNPPRGRAEPLEESSNTFGNVTRMCAHCKTVSTPLWRNGPNGPKTLCNACGIRYKKIGRRCGGNGEHQGSVVKHMTKRKPEADVSPSHPRKKGNTLVPNNAESARSFATDEVEGAALLMGLSCGLVNALA